MIDLDSRKALDAGLRSFTEWADAPAFGSGPLAGVRLAVKANIAVAGMAWTAGLAAHRHRIATCDADAVARLRGAGAAVVGTTNMEEAALGAVTRNPHYGTTENPHRIGMTAGGSSGGSGAAVAAGLCDVALGTDTMGSIRIPAAYCGVYGFKPANAAVSQDGLEIADATLDVIGPLARSLDRLEAAARAMSAFGEGEAGPVVTLAGLGGVACSPAVMAAYARAVATTHAAEGVTLAAPLSRIRYAGFVGTARALAAHLAALDPASLSPHLRTLIAYGPRRADESWAEDRAILAATRERLRALTADGTLLLLPTAPQAAFAHTDPPPANQADFTAIANIAGLPAISLPSGWDGELPVAVQLVGAPGREAGLFAAARSLDALLAAYRRPTHFLEGATP